MIVALTLLATAQLKATINPLTEVKIHKGELLRLVKLGGKTDYGIYRNVIVLKEDGTVINKAWNRTYTMTLNQGQWETYKTNLGYFPYFYKRLMKLPKAKKGEIRADRTEFYLQIRSKGKVKKWSSVGRTEPWGIPLFDTTDVWEYLLKNP